MKKMGIIILIIILILLAISLTNVLLFAIGNNNLNWFVGFRSSKELRKEEYIRKEENIELVDVNDIQLEFQSSDLNVFFTDENTIRVVQYSYKELEQDELFEVNKSSSRITISENRNPHFYIFYFNSIAYDIYLPKQYEGALSIKSISGDIELDERLKLDLLTISSTSGDIKMGDVEAKSIQIETVSGDIKLQNLKEETLKLKTTSGDISAESAEGKIEMKSTSGNIVIKCAKGSIEAKTTSGEIGFESIEGNANMQSVSGNIECEDFKMTDDSNIKTTSGEVKIYLSTESNCEIQTHTTSGNVRLPNGRSTIGEEPYSKLKVQTTSGNIRLEK